ncbi:WecB/TagA/CpsF family glycosyltransferase [Shimia abyssi]|uniref:WecB/TagA/CpsF family glycosyltransferase n=1 Tax=Shimia abyssi TaxID=1662395 RepID=UPI001FAF9058|nr:WecB/TagA/CpsF family glycosyltransferase [Shimia abyssi]
MEFQTPEGPVAVNIATMSALRAAVDTRFTEGEGFALATLNLDHLVKLGQDHDFAAAYLAQDFVVADGNPVVWLSRLAHRPVDLMPGANLVVPLAQMAAAANVSIALIGSTDDALDKAGAALVARVPGLEIAAKIAPPMGFDPDSAAANTVLRDAAASGARLAFLALGAPKQEALAARGRVVTPQMGFASIGASLDFLSGHQNRAPEWVQRIAMEWLWRLLSNPARLAGRYARCFAILPRLTVNALALRKK